MVFLIEIYKNEDLRNFYYNNEELPDNYSERESQHMKEVKTLINSIIIINILLIIALIALKQKANYKHTGISLIAISILLSIGAIFYQQFHHNIHLLLFSSNTWLLPADSILIQTYPLEYFRTHFIFINIRYLIIGIILLNHKFLNKFRFPNSWKDHI